MGHSYARRLPREHRVPRLTAKRRLVAAPLKYVLCWSPCLAQILSPRCSKRGPFEATSCQRGAFEASSIS